MKKEKGSKLSDLLKTGYCRPIQGFDDYYITADGSVLSHKWGRLRELCPTSNNDGHLVVKLRRDGRTLSRYIHQEVLRAFVGPRPLGYVVRHKDGDTSNNTVSELQVPSPDGGLPGGSSRTRDADPWTCSADKSRIRQLFILLNLYAHWLADPQCYTAYPRRKAAYSGSSRYKKLKISYVTVAIADALARLGYIENQLGFYVPGKSGRVSRMRATPKLVALLLECGACPDMIAEIRDREPVVLRASDADGKRLEIEYEDNAMTMALRAKLRRYNLLLEATSITLADPAPSVDLTDKFVYRVFNRGRWDLGGRFFGGWWQRLPKDDRQHILINDSGTVELDFGSLHYMLLYALEGASSVGDLYTLPHWAHDLRTRELTKFLALAALNARSEQDVLKVIRWEVNLQPDKFGWVRNEQINLAKLLADFRQLHAPISRHLFNDTGLRLQSMDAAIASYVIDHFVAENIPVLCIHDSFIVQHHLEDVLRKVMSDSYTRVLQSVTGKAAQAFSPPVICRHSPLLRDACDTE